MQALADEDPSLPDPAAEHGHPPPLVVAIGAHPSLGRVPALAERPEVLDDQGSVSLGRSIAKPHPFLQRLHGLLESVHQPRQVTLPPRGLNDHLHRHVRAVVQVVVLGHGAVAARLDHQRAVIDLLALLDHVLVPSLEPEVPAPPGLDKVGEGVRGHRVRDHGAPRRVPQRDRRHRRDQPVFVEGHALGVHHRRPVHVSVEDDAQIGVGLRDGALDAPHGVRILGVRHVVGEHAVGLQELGAGDVSAKGLQDILGKEPTGTVAGVHHDLQTGQGSVAGADLRDDVAAQDRGVGRHEGGGRELVGPGEKVAASLLGLDLLRSVEDLRDV